MQCDNLPVDINECLINNGGCHHNCVNSIGSYACQCNEGFSSSNNGEYCSGKYKEEILTDVILVVRY